jgi:uncharacterized protein involved in exopolysaccharide biosynthesis
MVGVVCLAAVVVTLVVTIREPRVYRSTATLLVPKETMGGGLLGGLAVSGVARELPGFSIPSLTPNRDLLLSVLKSRTMAQAVVERFGLQARYHAKYMEDAIVALQAGVSMTASKEGVITVAVTDTDRVLAAQMANFYLDELDRLVARFGTGEAGRQRGFLTEQLARAHAELDGAEDGLRRFQERNRAIVLQEQTRGAIEAAARLKGEIMAAEVQLQVMRNFATDANPEVVSLRRRIGEMNRQLSQMQYGDGPGRKAGPSRDGRDFMVPFSRVPEVGLELARFMREVKVQETVVSLLTQQIEQAKIAEAKDLPVVNVLDRGVPAERPVPTRLRLKLSVACATGLFAGIFLALAIERVKALSPRMDAA